MAKGRDYANVLVGPLDRSAYNTQRDVAQKVYNTNWQNVQNQYKNLQEKLRLKQEQANQSYAEGLADVSSSSYDRLRSGMNAMANKGLTTSGLNNFVTQSDTKQKGEDIAKLLKSSDAATLEGANQLAQATTKAAGEGTNLLGKLGDTLGKIGDAETDLQNTYNRTLANIGETMEQREFNNKMNDEQLKLEEERLRQARASASSSGAKSKAQKELEEFYKRAAINEVLVSEEMDDTQKANTLAIIFGKDNSKGIVDAYKNSSNATQIYNDKLADYEKKLKSEQGVSKAYRKDAQGLIESINSDRTKKSWDTAPKNEKVKKDAYYVLYDYINGNDKGYSKKDVADAYSTLMGSGQARAQRNYIADALEAELYPKETKLRKEYNAYKDAGITYEDLAAMLYGSK